MSHQSTPITGATLDAPIRYNAHTGRAITGDIWDAAWADDGATYVLVDDIPTWDGSLDTNLSIVTFGESVPPDPRAVMVNPMRAYGRGSELGPDGACWKADGLTCLDGVLYLTVSRHWYGHTRPDGLQIARDASIVASRDHGRTWAPEPPPGVAPFPRPLFPGPTFATPFFVKYGRDGAPPAPAPDEADRYVYAVSNDGYWDNGNVMHLGRVARADLPHLRLEDWEFCTALDDGQPRWARGAASLAAPAPILRARGRGGQAGVQFIPGLNRYLMAQWSYPDLSGTGDNFLLGHSIWEWYEAPHPWGPWTLFHRWDWPTDGFYNPSIPASFVSPDGGSLWALTTGDFRTVSQPVDRMMYTLYLIRATLHTGS